MNDTKWEEIRSGMLALEYPPQYRTRHLASGYVSAWDREWYYHFRSVPYAEFEWVEIAVSSPDERASVLALLRQVRVPGVATADRFRVLGYAEPGAAVAYIDCGVG